eukprot:scaffold93818_cov62-Phaeocystis_antarctica.AAC.4
MAAGAAFACIASNERAVDVCCTSSVCARKIFKRLAPKPGMWRSASPLSAHGMGSATDVNSQTKWPRNETSRTSRSVPMSLFAERCRLAMPIGPSVAEMDSVHAT